MWTQIPYYGQFNKISTYLLAGTVLLLGCLDEAGLNAGPGGQYREINPKGALSFGAWGEPEVREAHTSMIGPIPNREENSSWVGSVNNEWEDNKR